jgi:hypothetical protein
MRVFLMLPLTPCVSIPSPCTQNIDGQHQWVVSYAVGGAGYMYVNDNAAHPEDITRAHVWHVLGSQQWSSRSSVTLTCTKGRCKIARTTCSTPVSLHSLLVAPTFAIAEVVVILVMIAGESTLSFTRGGRWSALEGAFASAADVESEMVQIVAVHSIGGGAGGATTSFDYTASQGVKVTVKLALKDSGSAERVRGRAATPGFKTLLATEALKHGYKCSIHTGTLLKVVYPRSSLPLHTAHSPFFLHRRA